MWRETVRAALAGDNAATAIWAAESKLPLLSSVDAEPRQIAAGIREACWWIASLDDLLVHELPEPGRTSYKQMRDADARGQAVLGIKWVRNRHSHQLAAGTTREGDLRPFLPTKERPGLFISRSWRWHPIETMNLTADDLRNGASNQPSYEQHVARRPVRETLSSALS